MPVRVDYTLTSLGESLLPIMAALKDWAESHLDEVWHARTEYDSRQQQTDQN